MIRRTFSKVVKSSENTASFIASTPAADRYGDVVEQSWDLEGYRNSPVILLNHRQDMLPIGKAVQIDVVQGNLEIDIEFDMADELGSTIARKVKDGYLSAVSVGFQPKKTVARSDLPENHPAYTKESGLYFENNELLEVSVVTIPANSQAVAKKIDLADLSLKRMVRQEVKAEILALKSSTLRHILNVEETESEYVVTYAKGELQESPDPEIDEMDEIEEEWTSEEEYEDEDEKSKSLLTYLLVSKEQ
jgi:HK97 family phage prohead protease